MEERVLCWFVTSGLSNCVQEAGYGIWNGNPVCDKCWDELPDGTFDW